MTHEIRIEVSDQVNPAAGVDANGQNPIAFIRKRLSADEVFPSDRRYNPDTDQVEISPDGGSTWEPAPGADPRSQTTLPALTGSDVPCRSAASSTRFIKDTIDDLVTIGSAGEAATAIATGLIALLVALGPFSVMFGLALVIVFAFIDYTWVVISGAMTNTVYDQLLCILMCNMDLNGRLDANRLAAVHSDIDIQIGGTAAGILHLMLQIMGYGGINNAGAKALDTDDCSGCGCDRWCYEWTFTDDLLGWTIGTVSNDTSQKFGHVDGAGIVQDDHRSPTNGSAFRGINLLRPAFSSRTITRLKVVYDFTSAVAPIGPASNPQRFTVGATAVKVTTPTDFFQGTNLVLDWQGSVVGTTLRIDMNCSADGTSPYTYGGSARIKSVRVEGDGSNPFGSDNCIGE